MIDRLRGRELAKLVTRGVTLVSIGAVGVGSVALFEHTSTANSTSSSTSTGDDAHRHHPGGSIGSPFGGVSTSNGGAPHSQSSGS